MNRTRKDRGPRFEREGQVKPSLGVVLALLAAFLLASAIAFSMFTSAQARAKLLQQYQLEQSLAQLITGMQFNSDLELAEAGGDLPFHITAFGIYDQAGRVILSRGTAPESIDLDREDPREQLLAADNGDGLIYIRQLPSLSLPTIRSQRIDRDDEYWRVQETTPFNGNFVVDLRRPSAILVSAKPMDGRGIASNRWVAFLGTEILLACAFLLFASLYLKNRAYRKTLQDQQNLVTLGEAARTISHEIKNPLSAIGLRLKILDSQVSPDAAEDLEIIRQEVDRLDRMASKIGQFLKNPAGNPQPLDLRDHLPVLVRQLSHKPVDLSLPEERASVRIDPDHLRSILENILVNAWEAGAPDPLSIQLSKKKQHWTLQIVDRGPGIDPSVGDSIFKPFFTTKTRGSGIGLAIARRFAEAAGGSLGWKPNPEGGTIMILTLPEQP